MKRIALGIAVLSFIAASVIAQDRPGKAGADVASPSANIPPKKETLTQKVQRYEKAGYKIGVNFSTPDLSVLNPTSTATATMLEAKKIPLIIEDAAPACACFTDKTEDVITRLNAQYGTDIFERVDISKIPQRTVMGFKTDDWYSTKYKAVVHGLVDNKYEVSVESENKKKITADYKTTFSINLVEYINEKKGKQKYISQAARVVLSETYEAEVESTKDWKLADVKENVGTPTMDQLTESFESGYKETMSKFMDKLKKKK